MSTITHAIIGAAVGMILYSWTINQEKQFKIEHLILFAINSFIGPDIPKLLSPFFGSNYWQNPIFLTINNLIHTYLGWVLGSILLTGIYYAIFRLSKQSRQLHVMPIATQHIFLLIVAAGFCHFGIDLLDGTVGIVPIFFGVNWILSLDSFKTGNIFAEGPLWEQMGWFDDKYLLLLGVIFLITLIWILKNRTLKMSWIVGIGFVGLVYGIIILIGSNIVENENDLGILLYVLIAWIIPLVLCITCTDKKTEQTTSAESESTKT